MAQAKIENKLVAELAEREEKRLQAESPKSYEMFKRASNSLVNGVSSTYQVREPYPIYFSHGKGSKIYTVDGNELSDFHNGFGCMVQGHAHPAIVETIKKRSELGTQFALPTEDSFIVAEHLAKSFRLPKWRFVNSGSEATMDAIRIARAYTGRDQVLKIFGSYHGHHDYVMVSLGVADFGDVGPRDNYKSISYGAGIPQSSIDMTSAVPFNDAPMLEARIERLIAENRKPACLIMEAAMMNLGVVLPEPGYLQAVRDITKKHGIVLIFDEVKTGICTAAGGAVERFGVVPDMVTLAKALAGGLPSGAIGASEEVMEVVASGKVYQVGTYSGNPLSMAAARTQHRRGHDPRRLQAPQLLERPPHPRDGRHRREVLLPRLHGGHLVQGLLQLRDRQDHRLRVVHQVPERRTLLPGLALQHEPRRHHRSGTRRGMDPLGAAYR